MRHPLAVSRERFDIALKALCQFSFIRAPSKLKFAVCEIRQNISKIIWYDVSTFSPAAFRSMTYQSSKRYLKWHYPNSRDDYLHFSAGVLRGRKGN
jgi:hypothetical protein